MKQKNVCKKITSIMLVLVMLTAAFAISTPMTAEAAAKISKTKVSINEGKTTTLKITGAASGAKTTWATSNKAVATVNKSGKVKGVKAGTATITATVKEGTKSTSLKCAVTVKASAVLVTEGFENDMDMINFYGAGGCKVTVTNSSTAEPAYKGKSFAKVTGRTQGWEGPECKLISEGEGYHGIKSGTTYKFTAWVRNDSGLSKDYFKMTMKADGEYISIDGAEVTDAEKGKWVKIEGTKQIPKGAKDVAIYIEMPNHSAAAFSLDDFSVSAAK